VIEEATWLLARTTGRISSKALIAWSDTVATGRNRHLASLYQSP